MTTRMVSVKGLILSVITLEIFFHGKKSLRHQVTPVHVDIQKIPPLCISGWWHWKKGSTDPKKSNWVLQTMSLKLGGAQRSGPAAMFPSKIQREMCVLVEKADNGGN